MKADKQSILKLLRTAGGQVGGIVKMVEDDRYCIDISAQVLAAISILKKVNTQILSAHLGNCVLTADGAERQQKLEEIAVVIKKLS